MELLLLSQYSCFSMVRFAIVCFMSYFSGVRLALNLTKLYFLTSRVSDSLIYLTVISYTVSHRSECTPQIFVNILLYLFM